MTRIREKIKNLYKDRRGRLFVSFFITALFFIATGITNQRVFFINDDENIMYTLAGYYTGGNSTDHSFVNYVLGAGIRFLYTILPAFPWYGIYHLIILFFSVMILFKTLLKEAYYKNISMRKALAAETVLFFCAFLYPTLLMQFTTTSAYAGIASVLLLLSANYEKDTKAEQIADTGFSVLLMALCFMHRKNSGYVILCFYIGTAIYQLIKRCVDVKKRCAGKRIILVVSLQMIAVAAALLSVIVIDAAKRSTVEWESFYEYDTARYKMTDYPHDSFSANPQLYKKIGWNKELYALAGESWWFFMDPNINTDSFQKIAQTGFYGGKNNGIQGAWNCATMLFKEDMVARFALIVAVALAVIFFLKIAGRKKEDRYQWEYLYGICIFGGTLILLMYLCYKQRLPLRAFHVVILPFISIVTVLLIRTYEKKPEEHLLSDIKNYVFYFGMYLGILIGITTMSIAASQADSRIEQSHRTLSVENYAMEHTDYLYIYDTSLTFRYLPFTVYEKETPSNLMFWGGMGWNSPAFFEQLRINGRDTLYTDALFEESVYYVSWEGYAANGINLKDRLLNYMESIYPSVTIEIVDCIDNDIYVYKFSR